MLQSRSINIFLLDGDPSGIRVAQISMSTIQALAFRRNQLRNVRKEFPEIERPGVYILIGADESEPDRLLAYIGESENVGLRLVNHNSSKYRQSKMAFWTDSVALISKDDNLTKSHARYVESCLINAADFNPRWSLENAVDPSDEAGRLSRPDRAAMEEFVDQTKTLVGALGWDLFRAMRGSSPTDGPRFFFSGKGFEAEMRVGGSGDLVVQEGSKARTHTAAKMLPGTIARRERLLEIGVLKEEDGYLLFANSHSFSSPTSAASTVGGSHLNGRISWKLADGRTYADWEADESGSASATDESE